MRKREYIKVPVGAQLKMAADIGCSRLTIANALYGRTDSLLADKIRAEAVSNYGGTFVTQTYRKYPI